MYPKIENLEYWKTEEQNKTTKSFINSSCKNAFFFFFLCLEFLKTIWKEQNTQISLSRFKIDFLSFIWKVQDFHLGIHKVNRRQW